MEAALRAHGPLSRDELLRLIQGGGPAWLPEYSSGTDSGGYAGGILWAFWVFVRIGCMITMPDTIEVFISTSGKSRWYALAWILWNAWIIYDVLHTAYRHYRPKPLSADQMAAADWLSQAREKYYRQRNLYELACKTKQECDYARGIGFPHRCVFCETK